MPCLSGVTLRGSPLYTANSNSNALLETVCRTKVKTCKWATSLQADRLTNIPGIQDHSSYIVESGEGLDMARTILFNPRFVPNLKLHSSIALQALPGKSREERP
jgi:hypothetical protein